MEQVVAVVAFRAAALAAGQSTADEERGFDVATDPQAPLSDRYACRHRSRLGERDRECLPRCPRLDVLEAALDDLGGLS